MFTFKGISTKEMNIIVEEPDNLIAKAPQKYEVVSVLGKSDSSYYPMGYDPISISLSLQLLDPNKVDKVLGWLDGQGELVYKERKTQARIFSEVRPIRTSGIRLIDIEIIRAPFWYDLEDDYTEAWGANLIPNGWDSFEPYGSGNNELAHSETFENWDKLNGTEATFEQGVYFEELDIYEATRIKTKKGSSQGQLKSVVPVDKRGTLNYSVYVKNLSKNIMFFRAFDPLAYHTIDANEFIKIEGKTEELSSIEFGGDYDLDFIAWRPVIYKDGDEPLTVIKTLLKNGLTRIRTWGGTQILKLRVTLKQELVETNTSMYIKNLGNSFKLSRWIGKASQYQVKENENEFITFSQLSTIKNSAFGIDALKESDNLDFIASKPQIVEGDTPPTWEADEYPRIINEGTAPSQPLIKLTKGSQSTCEFEVNGVYFKYHFNNDDHVIIDCEEMEATYNGLPRNRHLTIEFEFPVLEPGDNVVKQISGDAKIEFKRKDRWL